MINRQLTIRVSREKLPEIEALLSLAGADSLSLDDGEDSPIFEPGIGETPLWPTIVVRALFPESADLEALGKMLRKTIEPDLEFSVGTIGEADWKLGRVQRVEPLDVGERLRLLPARESAPDDCSRHCIRLNMGLAFGTGRHPTTRLCLEWIDANRLEGLEILDYGCGSGVLAVAALGLGARRGSATDIDPQALLATAENAALNDVGQRLWTGPPDALPEIAPDVLFANILADSLVGLVDRFALLLRPGTRIVMSGILDHQVESVISVYESVYDSFEVSCDEGWARIVARRSARRGDSSADFVYNSSRRRARLN